MSKKGNAELYLFLAFSAFAIIGLTQALLSNESTGMWGVGIDCQSKCFGTEPGRPIIGQETLGGEQLRQCLSDCQNGLTNDQVSIQECYTCNGGGITQKITAEDQIQAHNVCEKIAGMEATITNVETGVCQY